ncbi:MAG: cysteine-rich CWC family protein [Bacteroidota bacterium]|nr:cysteine-rich CWC family protein [Ferruginibacter sp.]
MCKHEEKNCPRCNVVFECKVGTIANCQCSGIALSEDERKFIAANFTDCLCAACMVQLKSAYSIARREKELSMFFKGR